MKKLRFTSWTSQASRIAIGVVALALAAPGVFAADSRVFVTSTTSDGSLGGLAGADMTCNSLAATAGLGQLGSVALDIDSGRQGPAAPG